MDKVKKYWYDEMSSQIESMLNEGLCDNYGVKEKFAKLEKLFEDEDKLHKFTNDCVNTLTSYGEFWVDITNWLEDVINEKLEEIK